MSQTTVAIERELERQAGVRAAVEEREGAIVISGSVLSEGERQAALDIASTLVPDKQIVDDLAIDSVLPAEIDSLQLSEGPTGGLPSAEPNTEDDESLEAGDFTDQEILHNPEGGAGPTGTAVDEEISEGDEVWVPPTDPVRTPDNEFLGGFATSSMDSVRVTRSSDGAIGDEAIASAVRRELREDAATTDLEIRVSVTNGIVHLRGRVPTILDGENAEEVAGRVEGVLEVIEELEIEELS
jgi:osmotically-inducible protein OsmY